MKRLNPEKLHITFLSGTTQEILILPRRYTLTHSDMTGELFMTIGHDYHKTQISKLYTRLMRDEVLAELIKNGDHLEFRVYCHVSGGIIIGTAEWRNSIFHSELPLVLEAFRYCDRTLYETDPNLDRTPVSIYFHSPNSRYNQVETWGVIADYK
jgi:hypothetical protein